MERALRIEVCPQFEAIFYCSHNGRWQPAFTAGAEDMKLSLEKVTKGYEVFKNLYLFSSDTGGLP